MSTQTSAASTRLEQQQQQIGSLSNFSSIGSDYCQAPPVPTRVQLGNAARKVTKIAAASDDKEVQNNAKLDDDLRTGNDDDVDSKPVSGNVERRLQPDAVDQRQNIENLDQNQQQLASQPILPNQQQRRYNRISMIIFYGREALCVLALILTTYASIQNR